MDGGRHDGNASFEAPSFGAPSFEAIELAQATPAPAGGQAAVGRVDTVIGRVTITRADGTQTTAESGQPIFQGDQVTTAVDGKLGIVFADNSSFSIAERGAMIIDEMVYDPGAQTGKSVLSVSTGVFSFVSGTLAKSGAEAMVLNTPVAVIGIRGTTGAGKAAPVGQVNTFALLPDASGATGEVSVTTQTGTTTMSVAFQALQVTSPFLPPPAAVVVPPAVMAKAFGSVTAALPAASQPQMSAPTGPAAGPTGPGAGPGAGPQAGQPGGPPAGPGGPAGPAGPATAQQQAVQQQVEAAVNRAFDQAAAQAGGNIDGAMAAAVQVSAVAQTMVAAMFAGGPGGLAGGPGALGGPGGAPSLANITAALNTVVGNAVAAGLAFAGGPAAGGPQPGGPATLPPGLAGLFGPVGPGGPGFGGPGGPGGPGFGGPGGPGFGPGGPGFGPGGPGFGPGGPGGPGDFFGPGPIGGPGPGDFGPGALGEFAYGAIEGFFGLIGFVPPPEYIEGVVVEAVTQYVTEAGATSTFDEFLDGTTGHDTITGGDVKTQINMQQGASLGGTDTVNGGGGIDELTLKSLSNFQGVWDFAANKIYYGFDATASVAYGTASAQDVQGTITVASVEQIYADDGVAARQRLKLDLAPGTSAYGYILAGGDGADTISAAGSASLNYLSGLSGAPTSVSGSYVYGALIFGGGGDDTITGSAAGDIIFGGTGNDTIDGGGLSSSDNEALYGGDGDDTFVFKTPSTYISTAGGSIQGGAGTSDTLRLNGDSTTSASAFTYDFTSNYGVTGVEVLDFNDADSALTAVFRTTVYSGFASITTTAGSGHTLKGNSESATLNFSNIFLGAGIDYLTFTAATLSTMAVTIYDNSTDTDGRTLTGGAMGDTLYGYDGADTLVGGAGNDTLTGGAGTDKFVFTAAPAGSDDTITDYAAGEDFVFDTSDLGISSIVYEEITWDGTTTLNVVNNAANVIVLFGSAGTAANALAALTGDALSASNGVFIFRDSGNGNKATIMHTTDLANGGTQNNLAVLSNVTADTLASSMDSTDFTVQA